METGKTSKYLKYALGEIVLVVIGILIALSINNWNQERIQKAELNSQLQSISNGIQSDIRDLKLLVTARRNIGEKARTIFKDLITPDRKTINLIEVTYVNSIFTDINNSIYFRSNLSAFESLNNSTYFGKIQSTDLALLLNAYYTNADKIKTSETKFIERVEGLDQEWFEKFRHSEKDQSIFTMPWNFYEDFSAVEGRYIEILNDLSTLNILSLASTEPNIIDRYEEQILMGNTLIEMIENSRTSFDQQTKLDFSGILYSFADADLISILINGKIPTGFDLKYAASHLFNNHFTDEDGYLIIEYPENTYAWGSPYFEVNLLNGRVNEMEFLGYNKLIIEMKGEVGGETFAIAMKDKMDPGDGSESRQMIELTDEWKTYEIETSQFKTADMQIINVPLAFIFEGSEGRKIHLRSIQFKKI